MNRSWIAAAFAALVATAGTTAVTQPRSLPVDIAPCIDIESALARLDCYDALARAAAATPTAPQASRGPPAAAAPLPPAAASAPVAPDEFTSEIVALRELEPGRFEIELANGQRWRQTSSDRYRLEIGQLARVYRAREGSRFHRLTVAALRGFVQVERAR